MVCTRPCTEYVESSTSLQLDKYPVRHDRCIRTENPKRKFIELPMRSRCLGLCSNQPDLEPNIPQKTARHELSRTPGSRNGHETFMLETVSIHPRPSFKVSGLVMQSHLFDRSRASQAIQPRFCRGGCPLLLRPLGVNLGRLT